jgi:tRNA threonylcarbamoyladenosine biosynthesis protein TsaE
MEKRIGDLAALGAEAEAFVRSLAPRADEATLVTLSGELGAGKTAFVKAAAKALGVGEHVTSPTFVLEKIYGLQGAAFKRLVHIDAYRLESGAELAPLGFSALMKDPATLVLLEWPEKVADALPAPAAELALAANDDGSRMLTSTIAYA